MSYIDTTKIATDDVLVGMTSNVKQIIHKPTHTPDNNMTGSLSFERIHPRSSHFSVSDVKLYFKGTFRISSTTAQANHGLPLIRLESINSALYDTMLDINGSVTATSQPYINYLIKKQYDKHYYQEEQQMKHDKDVFAKISYVGDEPEGETHHYIYEISYECMSPVLIPELDSDLTGITNLNISSQVNLYNIIKIGSLNTIENIKMRGAQYELRYNEIQNTIPQESYNTMVNHFIYYKTNTSIGNCAANTGVSVDTQFNIRDTQSEPLLVYITNAPAIRTHSQNICLCPEILVKSCTFDINSDTNTVLSASTHDVYDISKCSGLLTEYNTWTGQKDNFITNVDNVIRGIPCPPVIACNMLKTAHSTISCADLFRLNVNSSFQYTFTEAINNVSRDTYAVYMYPSVLSITPTSTSIIFCLSQTFAECIEMDDDEAYFRQLQDSGVLSGGGKVGDFFKRLWNKIKSGKFISKALNFIGNTKGANNLLSMIPGVGAAMPIINKIQDIAGEVGKKAEDAGYGVNMF